MVEISQDKLLTRAEVAAALTAVGLPISKATLAGYAAGRGQGPAFRRFGRKTVYRHGDVMAWAAARLSAPSFGSKS